MSRGTLRDETIGLLQELLRLNTVNPPGNETLAAELLQRYLDGSGVASGLYARTPERANLVARIPGRDPDAPRLLLLSHTDTVVANPEEWTVDPWSGVVRGREVWGRGALDMKGQVAASAVAVASLAREGFRPSGDLIFAATADEEVGNGFGLSWLTTAHPEAVRAAYCINEGGGDRLELGGTRVYLCSAAEKASSPFRIRVHGRSGHASTPGIGDNALVSAARLIDALSRVEFPPSLQPETAVFLESVLGDVPEPQEAVSRLAAVAPNGAAVLEPMVRATLSPTQIRASDTRNVIPGVCELVCDCRLLPGQSQEEVEQLLAGALGGARYELEWLEFVGGTRSALGTPLWAAVEAFVEREDPGCGVVPVLLAGFTDSHYLREAFGTIAYGFFPMRKMAPDLAASLIHSADERVPIADLELGTRFLRHVAAEMLG